MQSIKDEDNREVQPTLSFQRVLQRAIYHVQSAGKKQVTTLNVLVAMFSEKDTHAVFLLNEQGVTRLDIVNFISHGIAKNNRRRPTGAPAPGRIAKSAEATSRAGRRPRWSSSRSQPQRARRARARSTR